MTSGPGNRSPRRWLTAWILYWIFIATLTHIPWPPGQRAGIPGADKVVHFCLYFGLAMLGVRWLSLRGARMTLGGVVLLGILLLFYGIVDELTQPLTQRSSSVWDWLADAIGIIAGTAFGYRLWGFSGSANPGKGSG